MSKGPPVTATQVAKAHIQKDYLPKALNALIDLAEHATNERIRIDAALAVVEHAIGKPTVSTEVEMTHALDAGALAEAWRELKQAQDKSELEDEAATRPILLTPDENGTYRLDSDDPVVNAEL